VSTAALAASGTLNGGAGLSDKLSVGGTLGAATISNFEILNVTAASDVSAANAGAALGTVTLTMAASIDVKMTVAQNEGLKNSATVSGTGQSVTLTNAGTTSAIAGVETYVLAAGANTIATGSASQLFNANALVDGDVLTLTGSHAASVSLVGGDLAAGAATGALTVTATTGTNVVTTGTGADSISAGTGDDTIDAGGGNDTVNGGAGSDSITLGAGNDFLVLNSMVGADTVADFAAGGDKVNLSKAAFTGLGAVGNLAASAFESGAGLTAAATAAGRVIYDSSTGDLYYDADGSGGTAAVLVATLTGVPAIGATNFVIVS
jgi:Ca2+-binding RTX toxin-like protein